MFDEFKRRVEEAKLALSSCSPKMKPHYETILQERKQALEVIIQYSAKLKPYQERAEL